MKTPKRDYFAFAPLDMYVTPGTANKLSARWKRKNRTARLKAKIARLTEQNKYLLAELRKTNEYYFNALQALAKKTDIKNNS